MKIIGYLRVSTDQQVESGLGLDAQKSACEEYAKKMGLEITEFFRDEGLSGAISLEKKLGWKISSEGLNGELSLEERPGMLGAINSLKKTDILVVAKRDRLSRNPLALTMIESAVLRKGAKIVSTAGEGTECTDINDPSAYILRNMTDMFAGYERLLIKARTKAALKIKKDRGERVGHIPFGYKLAENNVNLQQNEVECSVINNMKELRAKGLSIRDIAIALNNRSLLNRKGAKWNHASLHRVMKNQNVLNK